MSETQDSIADLERRLQERDLPTARQGEEARKGEAERVNDDKQAYIAAMLEKHHNADELHRRIRELEGDLDNTRHDLQAVHALHERLRQAEAERDEARKRIDELEDEAKEANRETEDYRADLNHAERQIQNLRKSEYDAHCRIRKLEGAVRSARLEIEDAIRERDELREQAAKVAALTTHLRHTYANLVSYGHRSIDCERVLRDTAAAAQAHDARIRAEGWREGLRQAVALLRAEADRREPHAEADALRVAADDLRARAENLEAR